MMMIVMMYVNRIGFEECRDLAAFCRLFQHLVFRLDQPPCSRARPTYEGPTTNKKRQLKFVKKKFSFWARGELTLLDVCLQQS